MTQHRLPAEFSPLERIFLAPPHNTDTWPNSLPLAQKEFTYFIHKLADVLPVTLLNTNQYIQTSHPNITHLPLKTNDSWIRDYGPIFTHTPKDSLTIQSFTYNAWGGKYPPFDDDNAIPAKLANHLSLPIQNHPLILEGGSIDVNGQGTLLTTKQCLLNKNRNPHLTQAQIESHLAEHLGIKKFIWLPAGIQGDDTDGHIDDIARFITPNTIVAVRPPKDHPDHQALEQNYQTLLRSTDQDDAPLNIIPLPTPSPIYEDNIPDWTDDNTPKRLPLPASYANFLIANHHLFLPVFNQPQDQFAIDILQNALPSYTIIPIPCLNIIQGLGALHCLSMQQPKPLQS